MTAPIPSTTPPVTHREIELAGVPGMGESYRRAIAGAARAKVRRDWQGLPEVALRHGPVRADSRRLADYQHLVGAPGTDELPAGFVHVLGFPLSMGLLTRPDFPLPLLGMVHVANRVTQARTLRFDEDLTFTTWADGLRPHRRGTTVDVHLTASAGDDVVWAGVSTYLVKGVRIPGGSPVQGEPGGLVDEDAAPGPGHHVWALPADTGTRYAEVSGDRNPIHTSRIGARAFGFPRPIAHGMYTAARALAEVPAPRGGALDWAVEFARPVVLPARVVLSFGDVPSGTGWRVTSARSGKLHLAGHVR